MSNDHIQVDVTLENFGTPRVGYGKPMIISHTATWTEHHRDYNDISGVSDDWASDTPEYISANAFFSQDPAPATVAIGRASVDVTQQYTIAAALIGNATKYPINCSGTGFVDAQALYTSSGAANQAEIHNGLVTQLNAVTGKTFTAAFAAMPSLTPFTFTCDHTVPELSHAAHGMVTGDGPVRVSNAGGALPTGLIAATDYWVIRIDANNFKLATSLVLALAGTAVAVTTDDGTGTQTLTPQAGAKSPALPFTVTANAANAWFSLEIVGLKLFAIAQTHAAPTGFSAALDAIAEEDDSFYEVHDNFTSSACAQALSTWAEANKRLYVFASVDTDVINTAWVDGVTTDVGSVLKSSGPTYTMGCHHPSPKAMFAAGWMGRWLPTDPGQATAKFKTLASVPTVKYSATQKANLRARRMNAYTLEFGRGITWESTVFSAIYAFIDVRRNVDSLINTVVSNLFSVMAGSDIIPFTAPGLVKVEGSIRGSLGQTVQQGILADGTTSVSMPDIKDVPAQDKTDRTLRQAKFAGTLAGAIHAVIPIKGTIGF